MGNITAVREGRNGVALFIRLITSIWLIVIVVVAGFLSASSFLLSCVMELYLLSTCFERPVWPSKGTWKSETERAPRK